MKRLTSTARISALAATLALAFIPVSNTFALPLADAPNRPVPRVSATPAHQALQAIADEYYNAVATFEPLGATENGDNRFDDQLGLSISPGKRALQFKLYRDFAQRIKAIKARSTERRRPPRLRHPALRAARPDRHGALPRTPAAD